MSNQSASRWAYQLHLTHAGTATQNNLRPWILCSLDVKIPLLHSEFVFPSLTR